MRPQYFTAASWGRNHKSFFLYTVLRFGISLGYPYLLVIILWISCKFRILVIYSNAKYQMKRMQLHKMIRIASLQTLIWMESLFSGSGYIIIGLPSRVVVFIKFATRNLSKFCRNFTKLRKISKQNFVKFSWRVYKSSWNTVFKEFCE
jgi:hypothetical protein